jgi:hypothetical protein
VSAVAAFVLVFLAVQAVLHRAGRPSWRTYSSPDRAFTASMPGTPTVSSSTVPSAAGPIDMKQCEVNLGNGGLALVGYASYANILVLPPVDQMLQGAKQGALEKSGATLVAERPIARGIEMDIRLRDPDRADFLGTFRIAWFRPYLYVYGVTGPSSSELYQQRGQLLESFVAGKCDAYGCR